MTIEFIEGEINSEQQKVPEKYRAELACQIDDGQSTLIDEEAVWMDSDGYLWIDVNAPTRKEDEIEMDESVRIFKLPDGYILDISQATGPFVEVNNEGESEVYFPPQDIHSCESCESVINPQPVIGLIANDFDRAQFQSILSSKYPDYNYEDIKVS